MRVKSSLRVQISIHDTRSLYSWSTGLSRHHHRAVLFIACSCERRWVFWATEFVLAIRPSAHVQLLLISSVGRLGFVGGGIYAGARGIRWF